MSPEFVFHIRNVNPADLAAVLLTLEIYPNLETNLDIVQHAALLGHNIIDKRHLDALITARDLRLTETGHNSLTTSGQSVCKLYRDKSDLFTDVIHGLQYTLWNEHQPEANCFSWSYRSVCTMLWQRGATVVSSRRDIASEIETMARTEFRKSDVSFSPKSVGGALLWLQNLKPEVLIENQKQYRFSRRTFCSPELFIIGVDFVLRNRGYDYGSNILLGEELLYTVCQVCLLEPINFDRVLEYAVAQFSYLEKGLGGGWGRYLILHRQYSVEDFI